MDILRKSNTDHTSGLIDESKFRTLIDDSKPRQIHTPYITAVNNRQLQQKNSGKYCMPLRPIKPI